MRLLGSFLSPRARSCLWVRVKVKQTSSSSPICACLFVSSELRLMSCHSTNLGSTPQAWKLIDCKTSLVLCAPLPQLLPVACRAILPYVYIMYQTNVPCQPFLERFKGISMVIDWVRNLCGLPRHLPLFVQVVISLGRFAVNCFEKKGETHWITVTP